MRDQCVLMMYKLYLYQLWTVLLTCFKDCAVHYASRLLELPCHLNTRMFFPVASDQAHFSMALMFLSPESTYLHPL